MTQNFYEKAKQKDREWSPILGSYASSFDQSNGINYFAGNSLGLMPNGFRKKLLKHADIWQTEQHNGHFKEDGTKSDRPWWKYQEKLVPTASELLGASPNAKYPEVALFNTLSVNNRNLIETFCTYLRDTSNGAEIPTIISIKTNFPSDDVGLKYALRVVFGKKYKLVEVNPITGYGLYDFDKLIEIIENEPNVIMGFFPGLCYITGQRFPIQRITEALHKRDAIAGFDLAHSMGNYQLNLHNENVDFATFCGYKYLCGGPGAVGGIFVHEKWFDVPEFLYVSGWFGVHEKDRFNFNPESYRPAPGAWGFLQSNDQVFNTLGVEAYFELVEKHGKDNIFKKNEEISTFMYECLSSIPKVNIITPKPYSERGCQILFKAHMFKVDYVLGALKKRNFCEKRGGDAIRVAPLAYNKFSQVWEFAEDLHSCLQV